MNKDYNIVFMGTPDFAVPSLQMLVREGFTVSAVVTQPDRKAGRGHKLVPPPVKVAAQECGVPVYQFEKISAPEGVELLRGLKPDVLVTAAFGQILSQEVLDIPAQGCINVHASLLPKYRGAAPIQWAIMNGEAQTGVTTMFTVLKLDAGDILEQDTVPIPEDMTAGALYGVLSETGAGTLLRTLRKLQEGTLVKTPQNETAATYFPMFRKGFGEIDFNQPCKKIVDFVRGTNPAPGAYMMLGREKVKVFRVSVGGEENIQAKCGTVVYSDAKKGLAVKAADGVIWIEELQRQGARRMGAKESLRGKAIALGYEFIRQEGGD